MAMYLNDKGDRYLGILNGIDYEEWNPSVDKLIPQTYSAENLEGKMVCKRALQTRLDLEVNDRVPLIGVVSRFANQKGLDLLADAIGAIVNNMRVQFAILGSGERWLENFFGELPAIFPGRIGSFIGYNNELAHWIEAGSDFFAMPSRYEPCGLNQIFSLKYGTLPIVRATGGLDDTVQQYNEATGDGTGFKFWDASPRGVYFTVGWAVSTYFDRPEHFQKMQKKAMSQSFTWEESAQQYEQVYGQAIEIKGNFS
jgi:starch synthase